MKSLTRLQNRYSERGETRTIRIICQSGGKAVHRETGIGTEGRNEEMKEGKMKETYKQIINKPNSHRNIQSKKQTIKQTFFSSFSYLKQYQTALLTSTLLSRVSSAWFSVIPIEEKNRGSI